MTQELIRTIATVLGAGGIIFATLQYSLQQKIWRSSHERARKEKAIDIMREFNKSLSQASGATYKIVERLDGDQCKLLDKGEELSVSLKLKDYLQAALPGEDFVYTNEYCKLNRTQSNKLRFQTLEILNSAEIPCQAWANDIAEPSIIIAEMSFLYRRNDPENPTTFMHKFRVSTNANIDYPALTNFIAELENLESTPRKTPNLIAPKNS